MKTLSTRTSTCCRNILVQHPTQSQCQTAYVWSGQGQAGLPHETHLFKRVLPLPSPLPRRVQMLPMERQAAALAPHAAGRGCSQGSVQVKQSKLRRRACVILYLKDARFQLLPEASH